MPNVPGEGRPVRYPTFPLHQTVQAGQIQQTEYQPIVYATNADPSLSIGGEYAGRTVASVTGVLNSHDTFYATMHLYDSSGNWTEIGWYFYQNLTSPYYEIFAFNKANSNPLTLIQGTSPGNTIYVDLQYSGTSSPPWFLWNDYLWNGSQWQIVAQGWLLCATACGSSPNQDFVDADTEAWTNENNDGQFLRLNTTAVADPLELANHGTWQAWDTSVTSTTAITVDRPHCMTINNAYYNWFVSMC